MFKEIYEIVHNWFTDDNSFYFDLTTDYLLLLQEITAVFVKHDIPLFKNTIVANNNTQLKRQELSSTASIIFDYAHSRVLNYMTGKCDEINHNYIVSLFLKES